MFKPQRAGRKTVVIVLSFAEAEALRDAALVACLQAQYGSGSSVRTSVAHVGLHDTPKLERARRAVERLTHEIDLVQQHLARSAS